jgi:hypothetical protein
MRDTTHGGSKIVIDCSVLHYGPMEETRLLKSVLFDDVSQAPLETMHKQTIYTA